VGLAALKPRDRLDNGFSSDINILGQGAKLVGAWGCAGFEQRFDKLMAFFIESRNFAFGLYVQHGYGEKSQW
jgi:hypothetical protein